MNSLRLRFLLISAVSIALVLAASGFVMIRLFEKNLERRVESELANYVNQIAAKLSFELGGQIAPPENLANNRFNVAYSGLYWQIDYVNNKQQLRSRSLWDYALVLPPDLNQTGEFHRYILTGPDNSKVIVQERGLIVATSKEGQPVRIAAAMDYNTITIARERFTSDMVPYLIALGFFLLLASAVQLTLGLRPLKKVQDGLNAVRNRQQRRLKGTFPREIEPLAQAVNHLLDTQDETLSRARTRATDLAHGLNTPLTVLNNDAAKLEAKGEAEIGRELAELADVMRTHIEYELARSRITPEQESRSEDGSPSSIVDGIVNTLMRTPKGEALEWNITVPGGTKVTVDPDDLRELLGNIIENAVKWAENTVNISGQLVGSIFVLIVEDDGHGLDPRLIETLMERGVRHDRKKPGTGIGMALVREICGIYDIDITIENRQSHGLSVKLNFEIA